jgi:DNA-binding NarL/FixJ family response regulator
VRSRLVAIVAFVVIVVIVLIVLIAPDGHIVADHDVGHDLRSLFSGYEVCRQLRDEFGDGLPVVFVSADRAESYDRVAGFLVGGDDFLVKPFALDEFVARVRRLLERTEGRRDPGLESPLTGREVQVLTLVAEGIDRDEIARRLFISPKTVGTHVERIFKKLGVHTRAQAVSFAYQHGLLPTVSEPRVTKDV